MRFKTACLLGLLAAMGVTLSIFAQEGHPLTGTWYGDWGTSPTNRTQITVIMNWTGKDIRGILNPGPDAAPLKVANLDSTKWMVHLEADAKDQSGNPVHIVADGKLDKIGSYNRTIAGTWTQGGMKGDFKLRRD